MNANGNTTARGSDSFAYDQANRLKSATLSGATSTYSYDGDGKRAGSTVGGTTTRYVYDVGGALPLLLSDGTRKYAYGASGLAYTVNSSSGAVEVAHTDGLGSVRALTDGSGALTQTYRTDPFGVPTATQGSSAQPFGYTGEQRDAESGLVYLRARMYDPQTGRFLQRDTVAKSGPGVSGWNRYSYANNNPVNLTDPSGRGPEAALVAVGCVAQPEVCLLVGGLALAGGIYYYRDQIVEGLSDLTASVGEFGRTLRPGPYARESIPARGPEHNWTPGEQEEIDRIGREAGCHTCGTTDPSTKSGHFIPDHQSPTELNKDNEEQRLYPHCLECSRTQGGEVLEAQRRGLLNPQAEEQ